MVLDEWKHAGGCKILFTDVEDLEPGLARGMQHSLRCCPLEFELAYRILQRNLPVAYLAGILNGIFVGEYLLSPFLYSGGINKSPKQ